MNIYSIIISHDILKYIQHIHNSVYSKATYWIISCFKFIFLNSFAKFGYSG